MRLLTRVYGICSVRHSTCNIYLQVCECSNGESEIEMGLLCRVADSIHEQQRILDYRFHTLPTDFIFDFIACLDVCT